MQIGWSVIKYFIEENVEISELSYFDIASDLDIGRVDPDHLYDVLSKQDLSKSDALFVSCTALPVLSILNELNVNNKIFVHCQAGISRSATNVIAYLMAREDMSLKEAFLHTKACRHQIGPNLGFMEQLMKYEKQIFKITINF